MHIKYSALLWSIVQTMAVSVRGYCVSPKMFLNMQVSVTNALRLQLSRILHEGQKSKLHSPVVSFTCCPPLVQTWPWDHRESSWPDFSTSTGASPPRCANVWLLCSELTVSFAVFLPLTWWHLAFASFVFQVNFPFFFGLIQLFFAQLKTCHEIYDNDLQKSVPLHKIQI